MTKHILWCGGSHLGHARNCIPNIFSSYSNTYINTAGPGNRIKLQQGDRYCYEYSDQEKIIAKCFKPVGSEVWYQVDDYDILVFVNQWVQFHRFISTPEPLSSEILDLILEDEGFLINLPESLYNEPLDILPGFWGRECCYLMSGPLPNGPEYLRISMPIKKRFIHSVDNFCLRKGIIHVPQPAELLNQKFLATPTRFNRSDKKDRWRHVNDDFWATYLAQLKRLIEMP